VDLLAIQQEICKTMTSMTSFFASLLSGANTTPNNDYCNNQLTLIAQMAKHMTTTTMAYHHIGPRSLQEYISRLHTSGFIPLCLLHQTRPCLTITSYLCAHKPVPTMSISRCHRDNLHQQMFQPAPYSQMSCTM